MCDGWTEARPTKADAERVATELDNSKVPCLCKHMVIEATSILEARDKYEEIRNAPHSRRDR